MQEALKKLRDEEERLAREEEERIKRLEAAEDAQREAVCSLSLCSYLFLCFMCCLVS